MFASCCTTPQKSPEIPELTLTFPDFVDANYPDGSPRIWVDEYGSIVISSDFLDEIGVYMLRVEEQRSVYRAWKKTVSGVDEK